MYCLSYVSPMEIEEDKNIPNEAIVGWLTELPSKNENGDYEINPNTFIENDAFVEVMHSAITNFVKSKMTNVDEHESVALEYINGQLHYPLWSNVVDDTEQCVTRPSPEHIFGSISTLEGNIIEYVPNFAFRLVTNQGVCELSQGIEEELLKKIKQFCT